MRSLLLLLLLLALALGVLFLPSDRPTAPEAATEGPAAAAAPGAPPAAADLATTPAPPPEAAVDEAPEASRTRLPDTAGAPTPAPGEESLLVEVVAEADDSPVADCTVYAVEMADVDRRDATRLLFGAQDVLAVLRGIARHYRTDRDGLVRIPKPKTPLVLAGEAPGLFRMQMLPQAPGLDRITLALQPERVVEALALDAAGQPQEGVPVVVRLVQGRFSIPVARTDTDRQGLAALRNFQSLTSMVLPEKATWEVAVAAPLPEDVAAPFDPDHPPAEPLVLHLPPTGRVVVEVRDAGGKPAPDGTPVVLQPVSEEEEPRFPDVPGPGQASAPTRGGRAVFPVVGTGLELVASANLQDYPEPIHTRAQGPAHPRAEVRILLQPKTGPTWLTGRLVDAEGRPMAERNVLAILEELGGSSRYDRLRTDAEGRFRYGLKDPVVPAGTQRSLTLVLQEGSRGGFAMASEDPRAQAKLAAEYPPGTHDLGDLRLLSPPLLAAGVVLTPDGRPAGKARVIVQVLQDPGQGHEWWFSDWQRSVQTDATGAFRLYGVPEQPDGARLRLEASMEGYQPGHAEFVPGQAGLTIHLQGAGRLRGSVLLDPGLEPSDLSVVFLRSVDDGPEQKEYARWQDHEFFWDALDAGTGRVEILPDGARQPVFVAEDVEILVGRENRDPRLQDIDLRGRLRHIRLEFVDETGRRVREVVVVSADPERLFWKHSGNGEMDLLVSEDLPPLQVQAEGYLLERLEDVREDRKVVLRKGGMLEFILDNPPALDEGWYLSLALVPEGGGMSLGYTNHPFDAAGRCRFRATAAGVFRLHGMVGQRSSLMDRSWGYPGAIFQPAAVTIRDPRAPATFHLTVDEAALTAFLGKLREK